MQRVQVNLERGQARVAKTQTRLENEQGKVRPERKPTAKRCTNMHWQTIKFLKDSYECLRMCHVSMHTSITFCVPDIVVRCMSVRSIHGTAMQERFWWE